MTRGTINRAGWIVPVLERLLPRMEKWTFRGCIARRTGDKSGRTTDTYVLGASTAATLWLALLPLGPPFLSHPVARAVALAVIVGRLAELALVVARWLFVDRMLPHTRRALLLYCLNLVEVRATMCVSGVLLGVIPVDDRWRVYLGTSDAHLPAMIHVPYTLLLWGILAVAVGTIAGFLKEDAEESAT